MSHIGRVEFYRAVSPLSQPIADSTHHIPEIAFIVGRLWTDAGVMGEAYLLAFHYSRAAIAGALTDIAAFAIGRSVEDRTSFGRDWERESEYFGNPGINRWALGLLNTAMWDAHARAVSLPVSEVIGSVVDRTPLYGSGGWLSYSVNELVAEVIQYKSRGFKAVKIKVGSPLVEADVERLRKVREAVGPSVEIMMDANQGMTLESATQLARAVDPIGITWFEEPLSNTDFAGYRLLHESTGISIAMGEREFNTVALRELASRKALDLWQPDIMRLGGVDAWLDSASLANDYGLPILPHYYKEYDVPLLMTVKGGRGAESFDWVDGLIDNPIRMENGFAYPNPGPGWGFRFKNSALVDLTH